MTDMFRVILTGSRTWKPGTQTITQYGWPGLLADVLDNAALAAAENPACRGLLLVHGACRRGADAIGDWWACDRRRRGWPVDVERHPADWSAYGRRAGIVRNQAMVRLGGDVCLAFVAECGDRKCARPRPHGSHGATNCADLAEAAGIHVQLFTSDVSPDLVTPAGVPLTPTA